MNFEKHLGRECGEVSFRVKFVPLGLALVLSYFIRHAEPGTTAAARPCCRWPYANGQISLNNSRRPSFLHTSLGTY